MSTQLFSRVHGDNGRTNRDGCYNTSKPAVKFNELREPVAIGLLRVLLISGLKNP